MVVAALQTDGAPCRTDPAAAEILATRFGPVALDADRQYRFRGGLPGFPEAERFQLDPIPEVDSDFMLLQAVDAPEVGFVVVALPDDVPVLRPDDIDHVRAMLDIDSGELTILAVVTFVQTDGSLEKFVNLRAPLFVDVRRKVGAQVVLANPAYPLRYRLTPASAAA